MPPPVSGTRVCQSSSHGLVLAVRRDRVVIALLSEGAAAFPVSCGDRVQHVRGEVPRFPVGQQVQGRMLTPLGRPADGLAPISSSAPLLPSLSPPSPPLLQRASPSHFVSTGFKHLDFFHPLTRGLRIGLLGERLTGKTTLALDALTFMLQQQTGMYGVYVCIGKKRKEAQWLRERLQQAGVLDRVCIVFSSEADSQASQYLAPFSGCTAADWYRDAGLHCVIVYDDLITHGAVCSGINRSMGYPALSISYIHARLLERTAAMTGGGSSTAVCLLEAPRPERSVSVIESLVGFVDHCVYLDSHMAASSLWPAVNCSSIIGRPSARFRSPLTRSITTAMSTTMLQSERTANQYAWAKELGLHEEEEEDMDILSYREKLQLLLSQHRPMQLHDQFLSLIAATKANLAAVSFDAIDRFEAALQAAVAATQPALYAELKQLCSSDEVQQEIRPQLRQRLELAVQSFMDEWRREHGEPDANPDLWP